MTSFWLLLSKIFKWSFGFYDIFGYYINWILFIIGMALFCYWCYVLYFVLGNNKDKEYHSPTEGKHPYYDPKIYNKEA